MFALDVQKLGSDVDFAGLLEHLLEETPAEPEAVDYARAILEAAWPQKDRFDGMISGAAEHWDLARMAVVDRNILRLALYELLERLDVPIRVVMDEAIELGRAFGAAETPQFINGILDAIWRKEPTCQIARTAREARARDKKLGPETTASPPVGDPGSEG